MSTNIVNIIGNNFGNQQGRGIQPRMMDRGGMEPLPLCDKRALPPMGDFCDFHGPRPDGPCPECGRGNELAEFGDSELGSKLGTASIIDSIAGLAGTFLTGGGTNILSSVFGGNNNGTSANLTSLFKFV